MPTIKQPKPVKRWLCPICGHEHTGDKAPDRCPNCEYEDSDWLEEMTK